MSEQEDKRSKTENPPSREEIVSRIRSKSEAIIQFCIQGVETNFYKAEQSLRIQIYQLACLYLELYLWSFQEQFDYPCWLKTRVLPIQAALRRRKSFLSVAFGFFR